MKPINSALRIFGISLLALASLSFISAPAEEELEFLPVVLHGSSVADYGTDSDALTFGPVKASIVTAAQADLGLDEQPIVPEPEDAESDSPTDSQDTTDEIVPSIPAPDETTPDDSVIPDGVDKNDYKDGDPDDGNNGSGNDEDKDSNPDDGNNGSGNDDKPEKEHKDNGSSNGNNGGGNDDPGAGTPGGDNPGVGSGKDKDKKKD